MKLKLLVLSLFVALGVSVHAQQVDPSYQINWPTCGGVQVYAPNGNACLSPLLLNPSAAQIVTQPSLSQPLSVNYFSQAFSNGVPMADQFCGLGTVGGIATPLCSVDACTKLLAANKYAVANGLGLVDATHFTGTQACSTNPFAGLSGSPANTGVNLVDLFGAVHFQNATGVQWLIKNSSITLRGVSPFATQVEYVGTSLISAVLMLDGSLGSGTLGAQGLSGMNVSNMYFYGDTVAATPNATDGVLLKFVNRSLFTSMYAWGVSNCGIETQGAVTDTLVTPRVSSTDAFFIGILGSHPQPTNGICLGGLSSAVGGPEDTTSGSLINPAAESVSNTGILLSSADQETIQGGTSEGNLRGIQINTTASGVNPGTSNKSNIVLSMDIEGNTLNTAGVDIQDNGGLNSFINILSASGCSSCAAVSLSGTAGGDYVLNGNYLTGFAGGGFNGVSLPGFNATSATGGSATALPSQPVGYIVQQFKGANVKIPYYN